MYLTMRHFVWCCEEKVQQMLDFRRELAWALINNPHLMTAPQSAVKTRAQSNPFGLHQLSTCPRHTSSHDGRDFILGAPHPYNQFTCKANRCSKRVRTYCTCAPAHWLCAVHWQEHFGQMVTRENGSD